MRREIGRPLNAERCSRMPARLRRAACWKKCQHYDRRRRVCRLELRQHIEEAVEGRHRSDE